MQDEPATLVRAGFWRRFLAQLIDVLVIAIPSTLLASLLFWASAGHIQASAGFIMTTCESSDSVPGDLEPPPPAGSNFSTTCSISSFAGQTASVLTVGRLVKGPGFTKTVTRGYMTDAAGHVIQGFDWSWVVLLLLLCYLIIAQARWHRSIGSRTLKTRLLVRGGSDRRAGVPWARVLARYAILLCGFLPGAAAAGITLYTALNAPDDVAPSMTGLFLGAVLMAAWVVWNAVLIARKRDPLYDRWAGTALVRDHQGIVAPVAANPA